MSVKNELPVDFHFEECTNMTDEEQSNVVHIKCEPDVQEYNNDNDVIIEDSPYTQEMDSQEIFKQEILKALTQADPSVSLEKAFLDFKNSFGSNNNVKTAKYKEPEISITDLFNFKGHFIDVGNENEVLEFDKYFYCDICYETFQTKPLLDVHLMLHERMSYFPCSKCDRQFTDRSKLNEHLMISHDKNLLRCESCNLTFYLKSSFDEHINFKHNYIQDQPRQKNLTTMTGIDNRGRRYYCKVCGEHFPYPSVLSTHELQNHSNFECTRCLLEFDTLQQLKLHNCNNNEDYGHKYSGHEEDVDDPDQGNDIKTEIKDELIEDEEEENSPISIEACLEIKELESKIIFESDQMKKSPYTCVYCFKQFKHGKTYKHHKCLNNEKHLKKYKCEICDRVFTYKTSFNKHIVSHQDNDSVFNCTFCNKTYSSVKLLNSHVEQFHKKRKCSS